VFVRTKRIVGSFLAVLAAYIVYALTVVPLVEPAADLTDRTEVTSAEIEAARNQVPQQRRELARWFEEGDWELENPKVLETANGKLLVKEYTNLGGGLVELKPCTMVFFPGGARESAEERSQNAVVLRTLSGVILEFDQTVDLKRGKIGNLIGGRLDGPFTITSEGRSLGPEDDLLIHARDAELKDNRIVSPHPIDFQFGANNGSGRDVVIELVSTAKTDKPSLGIQGIRSFSLMREVKVHIEVAALKPSSKPGATATEPSAGTPSAASEPLEIACTGPFHFDLEKYVARFLEQVDVVRLVPVGAADTLNCEELSLYFLPVKEARASAPAPADSIGARMKFPKLEPGRIEARGNPVVLRSPTNEVDARGSRLEYDLQDGRASMEGHPQAILRRGTTEITAPQLQFRPASKQGGWGDFSATGPGRLETNLPDDPSAHVRAAWQHRVEFAPHESEQLLAMTGGALLEVQGRGRIAADRIFAWFSAERPQQTARGKSIGPGIEMLPRRMTAKDNVDFASPQVTGRLNELRVWFEPDTRAATTVAAGSLRASSPVGPPTPHGGMQPPAVAGSPAGVSAPQTELAGAPTAPRVPLEQFHVSGGLLELELLVGGDALTLSALRVRENVRIEQTVLARPSEKPLVLTGDDVYVNQSDPANSIVTLEGRPAHVEGRGLALDGGRVNLNRTTNHLLVEGPGQISLPMDRSPDGKTLEQPLPLVVAWAESMSLKGRTVQFKRQVEARLDSRTVRTDSMEVNLTEPVVFSSTGAAGKRPDVAQIVCREGVTMDGRTLELGRVVSVEHLELVDLNLDMISGNVLGRPRRGVAEPAFFRVALGGATDLLRAPGAAPAAAIPAAPPQAARDSLNYLGVWFDRELSGNIRSRELVFHERVRTTYGPVANWQGRILLEDFNRPQHSGMLMSCDKLAVRQVADPRGKNHFELSAEGDTEIEGQDPQGANFQAQAARVSFDQSKDLLVLEGDGRADARLWRWQGVGGTRTEAAFRKAFFWRATNEIYIDDARSLNIGSLPSTRR
jgi:lipopolysaccharide export system protein LptA